MAMVMLVATLLGARLWFVIEFHDVLVIDQWLDLNDGGLVMYGGVIGAVLGGVITARRHGLAIAPLTNAAAAPLCLSLIAGRLGCWLNGCCYGHVTEVPWGLPGDQAFHLTTNEQHQAIWEAQPSFSAQRSSELVGIIHPTQLYEVIVATIMLIILLRVPLLNTTRPWLRTAMLLVGYGVWRFINEGLRGDNPVAFSILSFEWSWSRLMSVMLVVVGIFLWLQQRRPPQSEPIHHEAGHKEAGHEEPTTT